MEKKFIIFFSMIVCTLVTTNIQAQISHGGQPLPWTETKSENDELFVNMPAFDIKEELRLDSLNEIGLKGSYRFAYKFMTDYNRYNSGIRFNLSDGTRVWRLGIRSQGALSINVLFTEYELPRGAQLFLYNRGQRQILGAFNHLNNSDTHILPIVPIVGDEIIIEYQEPANAEFSGKLTIGEVNHAYKNFKREPSDTQNSFYCMPNLSCYSTENSQIEKSGRSVVLMIIDGTSACTGTLINNTENDGTPYILTASHCLNQNFQIKNPDYAKIAEKIVCFFNYNSPLCNTILRGTEEQSMASTEYVAVNEKTDMALVKLFETPPSWYFPYYSGWNAQDGGNSPYIGIHHPGGSVKRLNEFNGNVQLTTYEVYAITFEKNAHWMVNQWTTGCTAGGSSGSPLIDTNGRVIGALTGGYSDCSDPVEDYYYSLAASWSLSPEQNKQLKYWLNPGNNEQRVCDGMELNDAVSCIRLSNLKANGDPEKIETKSLASPSTGFVFGNNSLGTDAALEEYQINGTAQLHGTYLVAPPISNYPSETEIKIVVYEGNGKPETQIYSETFRPTYISADKNNTSPSFNENEKPLNRSQESFTTFSTPVNVNGKFYIGYEIKTSGNASFSAYNLPSGMSTRNTTWIRNKGQWIKASEAPFMAMSTSLFIDPVIHYFNPTSNEQILPSQNEPHIYRSTDSQSLNILLPENIKNASFSLIGMDGKIIREYEIKDNNTLISVGKIPPGIYIVRLNYNNFCYNRKMLF